MWYDITPRNNRDIYAKIDELADAINDTDNSCQVLMAAYESLAIKSLNELLDDQLIELSRQIHKCQDTLKNLKDERDALIDLLFD